MSRRRALLVSHDAGGTVPPMVALADALARAGHLVTVLGQPSIRARAEAAGARFVAFSDIPDYDHRVSLEEQLELTLPAICGRGPGEDLLAVAADGGTDLVVVDCNLAGAAAAAETLAAPTAVLLHSMYRTFVDTWFADFWPFMEEAVNASRASYGLDPCRSWTEVFAGHERMLAVVPTVLDAPTSQVPSTMRHFGFLLPPASSSPPGPARVAPGDGPLVLVSLSTTYQHQEHLLATIVEALGGLPVRALVTSGIDVAPGSLAAAPNVTVERYVPHHLVLPDAAVVVTHAGLGTVAGALAHGVPMVCTPIDRDQPLNAARVAEVGAGVALSSSPTAAEVAAAIEAVLADPSYRNAAEVVADASRTAGGPAAAAADLLALERNR